MPLKEKDTTVGVGVRSPFPVLGRQLGSRSIDPMPPIASKILVGLIVLVTVCWNRLATRENNVLPTVDRTALKFRGGRFDPERVGSTPA